MPNYISLARNQKALDHTLWAAAVVCGQVARTQQTRKNGSPERNTTGPKDFLSEWREKSGKKGIRDSFSAVQQYGGAFFVLLQYSGTFSAAPGNFGVFGAFSAVIQYGGTVSAVPGNSTFDGIDFGGSRYSILCGNYRRYGDHPPQWETYGEISSSSILEILTY